MGSKDTDGEALGIKLTVGAMVGLLLMVGSKDTDGESLGIELTVGAMVGLSLVVGSILG